MPGTILQAQGANYMQASFENAVRMWRRCWQDQSLHLDAEEVFDRFHNLLYLSTTMRVPARTDLDRQDTRCGDNNFPALLPVSEAFDRCIPVVFNTRTHSIVNGMNEYKAAPTPVHGAVYVQCHKRAEVVATTEEQRARMQDEAVFVEFLHDLDACIDECRAGHQMWQDYSPVNDGVRLLALYQGVIAVLAEMQQIRPYIINLGHDYVLNCLQVHPQTRGRVAIDTAVLVELPEGIRTFAPHALYLHVDCSHISRLPGWMSEFTSLTVLELVVDTEEAKHSLSILPSHSCTDLQLNALPDGMWQLANLKYLLLGHLTKIATLPSCMASMVSLHTLVLAGMFASQDGSIPGCIHTLPGLHTLFLCDIKSTRMQQFLSEPREPMRTLRKLHIFRCHGLRELPDDFAMFPGLVNLYIFDTQHLRILPRSIACLKQLRWLDLRNLDAFGDDDSKHPNSSGAAGGGSAEQQTPQGEHDIDDIFRGLDSLRTLILSDLPKLTVLPSSVMQLPLLHTLNIGSVALRLPDWFSQLPSVRYLYLNRLGVGVGLLEDVGEMQTLMSIRIAGNRLSHLPDSLCDLSHLRVLELYKLRNVTRLPQRVNGLVALEKLSVAKCDAFEYLPDDIDRLLSLHSLAIDNCPRLSELPATLGRMLQLRTLVVSGNVACLTNNSASLHGIAGLANLTDLTIGPWEGDNFPIGFCELVRMQNLALQVQSDGRLALRDPTIFQKIAWIISCMPVLESLRIGHGIYAPRDAVLFDLDLRDLSLSVVSLRAHPRMHLTTFGLYRARVLDAESTDQFRYFLSSARMPIQSYAQRYGLPAMGAESSDGMFLAHWRVSVEKVLAFLQATHPRLCDGTTHSAVLSAELFEKISDYFLHRPEFDDLVRGIAHM